MEQPKLRVAIVHNWLTVRGGSERMLFDIHKLYPDAPIYTLVYRRGQFPELEDAVIKTSWLQYIPVLRFKHELFPPLRYFIWHNTHLRGYDIVLSISSSENKAVRTGRALHVSYINTPPHYYWRYFKEYLAHPGFGVLDPLARVILKLLNPLLRRLDRKAAQNPDVLLANSKNIQSQVRQYYGRESNVLYPPVNTERFAAKGPVKRGDYYLVFGRQTVFKRYDLIIEAFNELKLPLIVAGNGPEHDHLVGLAGPTVEFRTDVTDSQLTTLVQEAQAAVFANEEDFGMTWVESMAGGTPVICLGAGGALETVIDGKTGLLFKTQTVRSLVQAVEKFKSMDWDHEEIARHAQKFATPVFERDLQKRLAGLYQQFLLD